MDLKTSTPSIINSRTIFLPRSLSTPGSLCLTKRLIFPCIFQFLQAHPRFSRYLQCPKIHVRTYMYPTHLVTKYAPCFKPFASVLLWTFTVLSYHYTYCPCLLPGKSLRNLRCVVLDVVPTIL